ncbi:MAG: L-seryl-tRNA(Sec) selenium transferase [Acidobacteria bacterium]|nr:L-seryl-tRNA(Sec) selenium transferase [Acidobacteriota bacterium]
MNNDLTNKLFREIPSVDKLLKNEWIQKYLRVYDRDFIKSSLSIILDEFRKKVNDGFYREVTELTQDFADLEEKLITEIDKKLNSYLKKVINGTGVILHTNLGRSPIPHEFLEKIDDLATGYLNLEFDLESGKRSKRDIILDRYIELLFPGYQSVIVNNNAAAVLLILNTFALGKEVVISRGELVEIGGSFRIPEVMQKSGAILKEVGTTNKTGINDYKNAISGKTGMLMTVHPSNYKISGFTLSIPPWDLVGLAESANLPLVHDMGSGNMFTPDEIAFSDEPDLHKLTRSGVPVITFSGDKLFGACQAGVIIGKPEYIKQIRQNQLLRALRVDKLTYLILEEAFKSYLTGKYRNILPIYRMLRLSKNEIEKRATSVMKRITNQDLTIECIQGYSLVGGGSAPEETLETVLISLIHKELKPLELQTRLRASEVPVITRLENDQVLIDLRTVEESDEEIIIDSLNFLQMGN